ncbi:MAG: hypothetical protein K2L11_11685 [Muribaculaceae bacterium]|nr:hypothetical protein [Muribaculaceae bacterium]
MRIFEPPIYFKLDSWIKIPEVNTTGTRDKAIFIAPSGQTFYFKTSINQNKKIYPFEFWSEIAADRLGMLLKLPVLHYHIASYGDKIGCLSENMIDIKKEELIEGVNFILQVEPNFREICKTNHHFEKIERALKSVGLIEYRRIAVEMVLFDCIIGNTDRHSENWALIRNKEGENLNSKLSKQIFYKRYKTYWNIHREFKIPLLKVPKLLAIIRHTFAPFYDNGSSLGRELSEERISTLLENETLFDRFFSNGKSDIIVGEEKMTFLETIDCLLEKYPNECSHFISHHLSNYSFDELTYHIEHMDDRYQRKLLTTFGYQTNENNLLLNS